ncbi:MAG: FecR domain-containing protein [Pseudomonadota bacterium]
MQDDFEPTRQQKDEAALWHVRRAGGSMSVAQEQEFEDWLNASRSNRLAFDQMRVLWARIEEPARQFSESRRKTAFSTVMSRCSPRRSITAFAGIAVAAVVMGFINPDIVENFRADIVSGQTVITSIGLPDGSVAHLAANSAVATDFSGGRRNVELLRGQAFFDVVHRNGDAFRVNTQDATVQVVGTRFNVDFLSGHTTVMVEEGAVRVASKTDTGGVLIGPGQQITVADDLLVSSDTVEIQQALAWMKGRLVVQNMRVADLMVRLENYDSSRIVVLGGLADQTISGSFPTTDIAGSLETVADAVGANVMKTSPWLTVLY